MKRNVFFSFPVFFMLCAGNSVLAQEPYYYDNYRTITVYEKQADETIQIDGLENEASWTAAGVGEHAVDRVLHEWNEIPDANSSGYAAVFKAVYDFNYLYLFVKVTDNSYVPYNGSLMSKEENIDNVELYFFPNPEGRDMVSTDNIRDPYGLSQLRASTGNGDNRATGGGYVMQYAENNYITGYRYKTQLTASGYTLEIAVPLAVIVPDEYVDNLDPGGKILFDINAANCTDYASGRAIILGWSTDDFHSWRANFKMGEMTFGGAYTGSGINVPRTPDAKYRIPNGAKVDVYDLSGRRVASTVYVTGKSIDTNDLAPGVYVVTVNGTESFKIVK
jgi:hypothetical protein